jgi:hypothetical protein
MELSGREGRCHAACCGGEERDQLQGYQSQLNNIRTELADL